MTGKLYYGDCLDVMQSLAHGVVDLIYLDPPFNSNRQYNAIYRDETGRELPEQVDAFCDMWELNDETEKVMRAMPIMLREAGVTDEIAEFWRVWVNALRGTQPRLLAYLTYMVQRMIAMRGLLKPSGIIVYHCDDTASHYVKVMMDGIFGHNNFISEIVWERAASRPKGSQHEARTLGRDTDSLFVYSKTRHYKWNGVYKEPTEEEIATRWKHDDGDGRGRYHTETPIFCEPSLGPRPNLCYTYDGPFGPVTNPHPSGWRLSRERLTEMDERGEIIWRDGKRPLRKKYLSDYKGRPVGTLWTGIPPVSGHEDMGYDTQKPLSLMRRVINAATDPGDLILDPFCGCATTLEAAHSLNREWVGIDIAIHAVKRVSRMRLRDRLGLVEGDDFIIEGVPMNLEGARDLWQRDKYHFQKWAVEESEGFVTSKRTADGGIDGRLYFAVAHDQPLESMVIEVKGGTPTIADVRGLRGVLEREDALLAGLIIMDDLGERKDRNFRKEMASAGHETLWGNDYPAMQMLTVSEILEGKRFQTPTVMGKHTPEPRMPGLPA